MRFKNFELDDFQLKAVEAIDQGGSVIVSAPTGSGKTLIADYIIDKEIKNNSRIIYTAPIKALSNQKYKDFVKDYGEDRIGLITGDLVINPGAQVLLMTTEVYRNMAIIKDPVLDPVSYCIMDEIHYLGDFERGYVWEESIIFSPDHVKFLFLSATIPNSEEMAGWVESIKKHKVAVVKHNHRPVPLKIMFFDVDAGITDMKGVKAKKELDKFPRYENASSRKRFFRQHKPQRAKPSMLIKELQRLDKLPCIYFVFSRAKTQEHAIHLAKSHSFLGSSESQRMAVLLTEEFSKLSPEIKGLKTIINLRECLSRGIGFHHAGLIPDAKTIVERLFGEGLIKVLFATETFAVGINMPARTVCFDSLRKYTDTGFRYLNSKEFFQISGRAGRRGIDKEGLSVSVVSREFDDLKRIDEFTQKDDLPINSQFRMSPNTVLNMINLHTPEEIDQILRMNFYTYQQLKGRSDKRVLGIIKARWEKLYRTLESMGYIERGSLTDLGRFTTHIFAAELELSQLFAANDFGLDQYTTMLILAAIEYEERKEAKFFETFDNKEVDRLVKKLKNHPFFKKGKWFKEMDRLTAIIKPVYDGESFLDILGNTNMLEGDIIRILMRILDKLEQLDHAFDVMDPYNYKPKIKDCKDRIKTCLKGIHLF